MKDVSPYITNDGSVGLYSKEFDDIYHSTFGAYAEACEKFVLPAELDYYLQNYSELNVLDICYGIGYNTKSFLHKYFEKIFEKKSKNFNHQTSKENICSEAIGSDNIFCKNLYIHALDMDKDLIFLSPFFTCNAKRKPKNQNLPTEKVKQLSSGKLEKQYDYDNFINFLLIENLAQKFPDFLSSEFLKKYLTQKENRTFFDKNSLDFYGILSNNRINNTPLGRLSTFLHNIYYLNISKRYKRAGNARKMASFDIDYSVGDARKAIIEDNKVYQLIFLDAFTPSKCPCLWSLDFFKKLYDCLDENGRLLTYSNSVLIRNAMRNAGFYVGKIYNERTGSFTGTIAVKKSEFIKYPLSEYDLRLMETRAGIFYRDENLTALNETIIERHKKEVAESPLMTSSKFIKEYRKENKSV